MRWLVDIRTPGGLAILGILILGIFLRVHGLATHFGHVDDLAIAHIMFKPAPDGIGIIGWLHHYALMFLRACGVFTATTYAPLPFPLTGLLPALAYDYESTLFLSRLPACLAAIGSLVLLVRLLKTLHPAHTAVYTLPALTLLACAWPHIIYAQQAQAYGMGSLAFLTLMLVFLWRVQNISNRRTLFMAAAIGAISLYAHYQMLMILPAFGAMLAWEAYARATPAHRPTVIADHLRAALMAACIAAPVIIAFLYLGRASQGVNEWNIGPHGEFLFAPPWSSSIGAVLTYIPTFFITNLVAVVGGMLAFVPESSPVFIPASIMLTFLVGIGLYRFLTNPNESHKTFGRFIGLVFLTWITLIIAQKLPMVPDRPSLILTPLFLVCVAEALGWLITRTTVPVRLASGLAVGVIATFMAYYPATFDARRDMVSPEILKTILDTTGANDIYLLNFYNFSAMRHEFPTLTHPEYGTGTSQSWHVQYHPAPVNADTLMFVINTDNGHLTPELFADVMHGYPASYSHAWTDYEMLFNLEETRPADISWTDRIFMGPNKLFVYVLRKK